MAQLETRKMFGAPYRPVCVQVWLGRAVLMRCVYFQQEWMDLVVFTEDFSLQTRPARWEWSGASALLGSQYAPRLDDVSGEMPSRGQRCLAESQMYRKKGELRERTPADSPRVATNADSSQGVSGWKESADSSKGCLEKQQVLSHLKDVFYWSRNICNMSNRVNKINYINSKKPKAKQLGSFCYNTLTSKQNYVVLLEGELSWKTLLEKGYPLQHFLKEVELTFTIIR